MAAETPASQNPHGTVHLRTLVMAANVACFLALVIAYLAVGPGTYVDGTTVILAFAYFLLLTVLLYGFRRATQTVTLMIGLIGIAFYAQRPVFLLLFPDTYRYSFVAWDGVQWRQGVETTVGDVNRAMIFLLVITLGLIAGLKIGEMFSPGRPRFLDGWLNVARNRWVVYWAGCVTFLIESALVPLAFAKYGGQIGSSSLAGKIGLHFVLYNGIYPSVAMLALLDSAVVKTRREFAMIYFLLFLWMFTAFITAKKWAVVGVILYYVLVRLVLGQFRFSTRFITLAAAGVVGVGLMFPLHSAVAAFWEVPGDASPGARWSAAAEEFTTDYLGYGHVLVQFSERFGGIDWITVVMMDEETEPLRKLVNVPAFFEAAANHFIPTPQPLFPDVVDVSGAIPVVVRGLPADITKTFGEYPTLAGWLFLLFGYGAVVAMFLYGVGLAVLFRARISRLTAVVFLTLAVWDLLPAGVLLEEVKTLLMYTLILKILSLFMVRASSRPAGEHLPVWKPSQIPEAP